LDFLRRVPEAPHTEDWEIDRLYRRLVTDQLPDEKKQRLLEKTASDSVAEIFGADIHDDFGFYVKAEEGERSLGTIRPAEVVGLFYEPKDAGTWDYRIVFKDQAAQTYRQDKDWERYERRFEALMDERDVLDRLDPAFFVEKPCCLLCSEDTPDRCHRRLIAERLARSWPDVEVVHLT
jgi:DNA-directed RNA polymerase subunit N (RpoN/RPB10)